MDNFSDGLSLSAIKRRLSPKKWPVGFACSHGLNRFEYDLLCALIADCPRRATKSEFPPGPPTSFYIGHKPHSRYFTTWYAAWGGYSTVFDHRVCGTRPVENPNRDKLDKALRHEVADQIRAARTTKGHHVHHDVIPFAELRNRWYAKHGITDPCRQVRIRSVHSGPLYLEDHVLAADWQAYHKQHAVLVSMTEHEHNELHRMQDQCASTS